MGQMSSSPELSLLIPTYNEAAIIGDTLRSISLALGAELASITEVILCDDGVDTLPQEAERVAVSLPFSSVTVIRTGKRRGKGAALAEGFQKARGEWSGFIDADLAISPIMIPRALHELAEGSADIVIGSRKCGGLAAVANQGICKKIIGTIFRRAYRLCFPAEAIRFSDSQCGFKFFRSAVARELYADLITHDGLTDLEILIRASISGYRVSEIPVAVNDTRPTKRSFWRTCRRDLTEMISLLRRYGRFAKQSERVPGVCQ